MRCDYNTQLGGRHHVFARNTRRAVTISLEDGGATCIEHCAPGTIVKNPELYLLAGLCSNAPNAARRPRTLGADGQHCLLE